ncbi:MAG: gamma carbonic anhydrase family protein [Phycisphaerae bacterium]|nr:gamma carbonic anhydrase family protein [Phycisphaerales bacterium]
MSVKCKTPRIGRDVYISPTSYVCGDLEIGDGCTIMHHVCIRGDIAPIRIGPNTNIQDGVVLHTRYGIPLDIEERVVVGHRAVVHCRRVGANSLIGIGAIVLDEAEIGKGAIVAAGAVVRPGTKVAPGTIVGGVPAKYLRDLNEEDHAEIQRIVDSYVEMGRRYASGEFPPAGLTQSASPDRIK